MSVARFKSSIVTIFENTHKISLQNGIDEICIIINIIGGLIVQCDPYVLNVSHAACNIVMQILQYHQGLKV